jgi:branched-chain amino acid transport system permease protein
MSKTKAVVLAVVGLVVVTLPLYATPYMLQIATTTTCFAMLGLAFGLGMRVGLPRLDIAAWWGVGGYATAVLMKHGVSFWLTVPAGGLIAVIISFLVFSLALPRGMVAFFVFSMVIAMAFSQVFGSLSFLGGWGGITNVPSPTVFGFPFDTQNRIYYLGLLFILVTIAVYLAFYHSRIGRAWDAITSSPKLASSVGVDVVRYRMVNILVGSFLIAATGSFYVIHYHAAIPSVFSFNAGVNTIAFLFIGGFTHSLAGPILGAFIVTFVPEYLQFAQTLRPIIIAAVVILILMFLPAGILGVWDNRIKPFLLARSREKRE